METSFWITGHRHLGELVIALTILLALYASFSRKTPARGLRMAVVGLLDLQVLWGVVMMVVLKLPLTPFVLHPALMILAAVVAHLAARSPKPVPLLWGAVALLLAGFAAIEVVLR
ncbi:MAG: hypothetical protein K6T57_00395 [Thermaceae bacterium]|nr:hypothetical protein [Thermaceae bacterium]